MSSLVPQHQLMQDKAYTHYFLPVSCLNFRKTSKYRQICSFTIALVSNYTNFHNFTSIEGNSALKSVGPLEEGSK